MQVVWCCRYGSNRCADMLRHSILLTRIDATKKEPHRKIDLEPDPSQIGVPRTFPWRLKIIPNSAAKVAYGCEATLISQEFLPDQFQSAIIMDPTRCPRPLNPYGFDFNVLVLTTPVKELVTAINNENEVMTSLDSCVSELSQRTEALPVPIQCLVSSVTEQTKNVNNCCVKFALRKICYLTTMLEEETPNTFGDRWTWTDAI